MEQLEKYFDTAFGAPDGVKKLRELILAQALKGKLTSQVPLEGTATELLKEILKEKKLAINYTVSANENSTITNSTENPFTIPKSWVWSRLGDISIKIHYGYTASADFSKKHVKLLRITDIQDNKVNWDTVPGCDAKKDDLIQYLLNNNDILIARTGGTVGKSFLVQDLNVDSVFASYLIRVIPSKNINVQYLKYFLESPLYWKQLLAACSGTGQPNVNGTSLYNLQLPIPPRKEQQRIIVRIEQLLTRCDELEKLRSDRDQKRLAVHTAAIRKMLDALDQETFDVAWQFITRHFGDLYTVRENVAELRKAILQLAVMGKLVKQEAREGTARELLQEIEKEKRKMVKEGKIKGKIALNEINPKQVPYKLPQSWIWTRLGNAGELDRGKSKHRPRNDRKLFINGKYPLVQTGDVSRSKDTNHIIMTYGKQYNEFGLSQSRLWDEGTLCITIAANIAETGFLGMKSCIPDSVVAFRSIDTSMTKFVKYYLDVAKEDLENFAPSTAQKNINLEILNDLVFPLPPLKEQKRIILKVETLMAHCDLLEQSIDMSMKKQGEVLGAVMEEAVLS